MHFLIQCALFTLLNISSSLNYYFQYLTYKALSAEVTKDY